MRVTLYNIVDKGAKLPVKFIHSFNLLGLYMLFNQVVLKGNTDSMHDT